VFLYLTFLLGLFLIPGIGYAQEQEMEIEESAEVSLEEYSDAFQENFFDALKQKGIENYDKAITLLLQCKELDADNSVVDHELAKAYLEDKQFMMAQEYGVEALVNEPANLWYLNTLVQILDKQGGAVENIKSNIPFDNNKLKENLALIYFKQKKYESSLALLKLLKSTAFTEDLTAKISDSLEKKRENNENRKVVSATNGSSTDPLERYKKRVDDLMVIDSFSLLETVSLEALESYPSQPYFYFAQGYALNKMGKHNEAVEVLEAALDYLLDDVPLSNKIYAALSDAYSSLNNTSKANMYLRKIKPGF
tara:strand:+ start:208703 stop:209629 length:927 start_codon:yes stop_codon:yes gene_type:complete